jgi:ABC-type multidrug transport system ATPase subunit
MLSCIVGLRKLDSGEVRVFGYQPGTPESGIPGKTIGYMPQVNSISMILHCNFRTFAA